jgi:hypothetical protein
MLHVISHRLHTSPVLFSSLLRDLVGSEVLTCVQGPKWTLLFIPIGAMSAGACLHVVLSRWSPNRSYMVVTARGELFALGNGRDPILKVFSAYNHGWSGVDLVDIDLEVGSVVTHGGNPFAGQLKPYTDQSIGLYNLNWPGGRTRYQLIQPKLAELGTATLCFRPFPTGGRGPSPMTTPAGPQNGPPSIDLSRLRLSMASSNEPDPLDLTLG